MVRTSISNLKRLPIPQLEAASSCPRTASLICSRMPLGLLVPMQNIHPYASLGQSPLLWRGPPSASAILSRGPWDACMHAQLLYLPQLKRNGGSSVSYTTPLFFAHLLLAHAHARLCSDRTGCQHLLAQVVLVLPDRAVPRLDGLVLAHQDLLCNLVQQSVTEGQLNVAQSAKMCRCGCALT